ncbi:leucine--tRNA ligase [bacterium]|nr:leucine--tRNA ligase [bacterium]
MSYDHLEIEAKWQREWTRARLFSPDLDRAPRPYYNLMMFPYPSAEGLHVGNCYAFIGSDIHGRFKKMQGFDVFEPMGFDAFGIHSENYAIKIGTHPARLIPKNIANFRDNQLKRLGAIFDWEHAVDTTDPGYYKWTQWIFLRLYDAGLAYQRTAGVNWCPSCATVLADEQAESGACERCGTVVETREMRQWFFKITDYAPRLLENLSWIDWPDTTKTAQRRWLGRSEGANIRFAVEGRHASLEVYTTRPDTLFGATYMVLAPEHEIVASITTDDQREAVRRYVELARKKTKFERQESKEKTGVFTGAYAINPVNDARVPIWIADYVLSGYGTGAIMAVPAHDTRDFAFAKEFGLPIVEVIAPDGVPQGPLSEAYTGEGLMVNSGELSGTPSDEGIAKVIALLESKGTGEAAVTYRLRDWCISRQRYWGPPIPVIYCDGCGVVPVPDTDLPVLLPEMENVRPDGSGLSPLARNPEFVNTTCPKCGGKARRETDVCDNFLDSAWYFFRYPSTDFDDRPFDRERTKKWLPVDCYIGGNEHAVLHLMYTRFVTMALHDAGHVEFDPAFKGEPFRKFRAHGMLIREGSKMSKSKGNIVNPDEFLDTYGADTFRLFLMFLGPYTQGGDWRDEGIIGARRFVERVWRFAFERELHEGMTDDRERLGVIHRTIRKVTNDLAELSYNTAIAALMELVNDFHKRDQNYKGEALMLARLVAPICPHVAEEVWTHAGGEGFVSSAPWPDFDEELCKEDTVIIVVQVNGRLRGRIDVPADLPKDEVLARAKAEPNVAEHLAGKMLVKEIVVPGKLVNLVVT